MLKMMCKYLSYHYEYHSNNSVHGALLKLVVADPENKRTDFYEADVFTTLFTRARFTVPDECSTQVNTLYFMKRHRNITLQIMPHKHTNSLTN